MFAVISDSESIVRYTTVNVTLNARPTSGGHAVNAPCPVHSAEKRCHTRQSSWKSQQEPELEPHHGCLSTAKLKGYLTGIWRLTEKELSLEEAEYCHAWLLLNYAGTQPSYYLCPTSYLETGDGERE